MPRVCFEAGRRPEREVVMKETDGAMPLRKELVKVMKLNWNNRVGPWMATMEGTPEGKTWGDDTIAVEAGTRSGLSAPV